MSEELRRINMTHRVLCCRRCGNLATGGSAHACNPRYTVVELLARVEAMSNEDVCFVAVWHREIRSASDELLAADGRREFAAILREITRDGP